MSKKAVSVTLDRDNLLWLRARTVTGRRRSLSATLDEVVAEARGRYGDKDATSRTVVGTIKIADSDPDLSGADAAVRSLIADSLSTRTPESRHPRSRRKTRVEAKATRRRG